MRQVKLKPFLEYLQGHSGEPEFERELPFKFRHSARINPFTVLCSISIFCLLLGFKSTLALSVGLALLVLLTGLFIQGWHAAQNLYIERIFSIDRWTEDEAIEITYDITNTSITPSPPISVEDYFGASQEDLVYKFLQNGFPARARRNFKVQKICDAGMGKKQVGPLTLSVSDSLGVFEFRVVDSNIYSFQVHAKIGNLPDLPVKGSPYSGDYGKYSLANKGHSVNFTGVREYNMGDSLRHIAWRLSAKKGELLVKEFEKVANSEVALVLNLDPRLHIGIKALSTWEYARDVTLAIASQQAENGNTISFYSNTKRMDPFRGMQNLPQLSTLISELNPIDIRPKALEHQAKASPRHLTTKYAELFKPFSTVFYVTPYIDNEAEAILDGLKTLRAHNVNVFCVLIDVASFHAVLSRKIDMFFAFICPKATEIDTLVHELRVAGIDVFCLKAYEPINQSLLKGGRAA